MYNIKFNLNNQEINIPSDNNINKNISDNLESHNTNINSHTDIRTQLGNFGGVNTNYDFFDTLNLDWTYAGKIIRIGASSNKTQIINLPDLDGNQHCTQMIHILYDQDATNYNTITIKAPY